MRVSQYRILLILLSSLLCRVAIPNAITAQEAKALAVEDALKTKEFGPLMPIALSPDGRQLATVSDDKRLVVEAFGATLEETRLADPAQALALYREVLALDQETRWRLEDAVERAKAREQAQGRPFSRRDVNAGLRDGEHHNLMHQQW